MRRLIVCAYAFAVLVGCSSGAFEGAAGKSDEDKDSNEDEAADEAADDDVIDDPQIVAGAFLTCDKYESGDLEVDATEIAIFCDLQDDDGPIEKGLLDYEWSAADGAGKTFEPEVSSPAHDVTFVFERATVNEVTIHLVISKGGDTQDVSIKLDGIEVGEISSKPYVVGFSVDSKNANGESYVDNIGSFVFDWRVPEIRVKNTNQAAVVVNYTLSLSDGSKLLGQVISQAGVSSQGPELIGDWTRVKGVDLAAPTLIVAGRLNNHVIDTTGSGTLTPTTTADGLPEFSFSDFGVAGSVSISGTIPLIAE